MPDKRIFSELGPNGVQNSMHQANTDHQKWLDRNDVDKAFKEWDAVYPIGVYLESDVKDFAVFYAERVKGGCI